MTKILFLLIACLLIAGRLYLIVNNDPISNIFILVTESSRRQRRQNNGYNFVQQYDNQYELYGPGGQGWVNNYNNNRYPNPNFVWNNNWNWNQGNRRPEWYYNSSKTIQPSIFCLIIFGILCLLI
jgi:hypothetical protein